MNQARSLFILLGVLMASGWGLAAPSQAQHHDSHAQVADHETDEAGHGGSHHDNDHGISAVFSSFEFWAMVVNFILLLLILVKIAGKPINSLLHERKETIATGLNEAARIKAEAEAIQKEYAERLAQLDQQIEALHADMVKAGEAERDRLVAEAEAKAARMRRETEFLIEQRMKQLRIDLGKEAIEAAVQTAEQLLRKELTEKDQQRLAEQFLQNLGSKSKHRKVA